MANSMILTIPVQPEKRNEFLDVMRGALPDTRAFDGCKRCDVWTEEDNESNVHFLEVWESKAHQEKYFAWRIETGLMDALAPFLAGEPKVTWLAKHDDV